jgi:hypothetical protein
MADKILNRYPTRPKPEKSIKTRLNAPSAQRPAPSTGHPAPGTQHRAPSTGHNAPKAKRPDIAKCNIGPMDPGKGPGLMARKII